MGSDAYADAIESAYQGELLGEAFFAALAEARSDPEEARKLRVLERLERETKERLLPAVRELGRATDANAEQLAGSRAIATQMGEMPWRDRLTSMRPELVKLVDTFHEQETLAPPGEEALSQHVTAHEQALLDFVDGELAGAPDSLASIERLLR